MHLSKFLLPSISTLILLSGYLIADEAAQDNSQVNIEEHVPVRSRDIDPEKRQWMKDSRAMKSEASQESDQNEGETISKASGKISSQSQFMLAPSFVTTLKPTLAAYSFPINCHWLTSVSDNSRSLELEDGSHWEISPADVYTLRNWRREDSLVITPNYSWLSSYDYYISNKNDNSYVKANLYIGPTAFGPFSHWIVDIDYTGGHVYLENQMIWCINPQDSSVLKDWAINDHVIFGLYDNWFSNYDHILINVNMDDHLRAKQY